METKNNEKGLKALYSEKRSENRDLGLKPV